MERLALFYIPWKKKFGDTTIYKKINHNRYHQYKNKHYFVYQNEHLKWWGKPYFGIINETGMIEFFIKALCKPCSEEARTYLSKEFEKKTSLEDVQKLFNKVYEYGYPIHLYFDKQMRDEMKLIPIQISTKNINGERQLDIIHIQIINEPNQYGKWKIYRIVKE